ncbi:MAG: inositol monophosphatase family protein [Bacteroidota bacterium]
MEKQHLERLCRSTCDLVGSVAGFIEGQLNKVKLEDIETKSLNSLVSYVDKKAEVQLVSGLRSRLEDSTFLTEEDTIENEEGEYRWIIDPLDGTTNFLHQLPFFAISVALEHRGELIMGVVFEVNRKECFYAWKGGGAWLNRTRIQVNNNERLQDALLSTGFPYYDYTYQKQYFACLSQLSGQTRGIRRYGAAALDLAYVACGRFDAYFEYSLQPWDVAAGIVIIREAGGILSDFEGGDNYLFGQQMIAGNPTIQPIILSTIQHHFSQSTSS